MSKIVLVMLMYHRHKLVVKTPFAAIRTFHVNIVMCGHITRTSVKLSYNCDHLVRKVETTMVNYRY
jgi:hypothetical protein